MFVSGFANSSAFSETNGSYPKQILVLERLNLQLLQLLRFLFSFIFFSLTFFSPSCCSHFGAEIIGETL
jgi:hypothetical protein